MYIYKFNIFILSNLNGFSLLQINDNFDILEIKNFQKKILARNIKCFEDLIIISDRLGSIFLYNLKIELIKEINFLSPIIDFYNFYKYIIIFNICGEIIVFSKDNSSLLEKEIHQTINFNEIDFSK